MEVHGYGYCEVCGKPCKNRFCSMDCRAQADRRAERPRKLELVKMVLDQGFTAVARHYGVGPTTITRWLKFYGLPETMKGLRSKVAN